MSTITYPNGTQLTSTALTDDEISKAFQIVTAQMLGILTSPIQVTGQLVGGQFTFTVDTTLNLYIGESISGNGLVAGTSITAVDSVNNIVTVDKAAISTQSSQLTVSDPNVYAKVRVGWPKEGQPGPVIDSDTVTIRCSTINTEYSRMRDITTSPKDSDSITQTDIYTRAWRVYWTLYGDNALDNARAIMSGLITADFVSNYLAGYNLYVNPDIEPPGRNPELFQGRWWERTDLSAEFNEQVTETIDIGLVKTVEVKGFTKDGQFMDETYTVS